MVNILRRSHVSQVIWPDIIWGILSIWEGASRSLHADDAFTTSALLLARGIAIPRGAVLIGFLRLSWITCLDVGHSDGYGLQDTFLKFTFPGVPTSFTTRRDSCVRWLFTKRRQVRFTHG